MLESANRRLKDDLAQVTSEHLRLLAIFTSQSEETLRLQENYRAFVNSLTNDPYSRIARTAEKEFGPTEIMLQLIQDSAAESRGLALARNCLRLLSALVEPPIPESHAQEERANKPTTGRSFCDRYVPVLTHSRSSGKISGSVSTSGSPSSRAGRGKQGRKSGGRLSSRAIEMCKSFVVEDTSFIEQPSWRSVDEYFNKNGSGSPLHRSRSPEKITTPATAAVFHP